MLCPILRELLIYERKTVLQMFLNLNSLIFAHLTLLILIVNGHGYKL